LAAFVFFTFIGLAQQIKSQVSTQPHSVSTLTMMPQTSQASIVPFLREGFFGAFLAGAATAFFAGAAFAGAAFAAFFVAIDSLPSLFCYLVKLYSNCKRLKYHVKKSFVKLR
jgi:hypothetical protein